MDLGLQGRVALVTGASRGIGRAIAETLAREGARVAVAARSREDLHALASRIDGRGSRFDSEDLDSVPSLIDEIEADLGSIDVYICNTGGPPAAADPLGFDVEQWEAANRTLVLSPMTVLRRLLPGMRERRFGRIVAVSSSAAREPLPWLQLSNTYRPGLLAAFKHLAVEVAADGVTLNAVLPGRIATQRWADASGGLEEAHRDARTEVPAGRLGTAEELAAVAAFLCSQQASYLTGQSILVDGGLTRSW
jgi:3-oxoacyl-[acyl-carrier protein] reductase